jgi:hypothetical protein
MRIERKLAVGVWRLGLYREKESTMKGLVSIIALTLAVVFAAPASAAPAAPTNKADCEKAGMKWDATANKCQPGKM